MDSNFLNGLGPRPYEPIPAQPAVKRPVQHQATASGSAQVSRPFAEVLQQVQGQDRNTQLHISAHALSRMKQRGLQLTQGDMLQLSDAVGQAANKGAKDAYVLYGDVGLVVNVPNRTVVTAMQNQETTVVTNIDSVVVVPRLDR